MNLHSERSRIPPGFTDFHWPEAGKSKICFQALWKLNPSSLILSTGFPGIVLMLSLIVIHYQIFKDGQGQNLRGRNLKLIIKECIGCCRREGKNRIAKI